MEYDSNIASQFYQNNRYRDQFDRKSLLLHIKVESGETSFIVELPEELIINNIKNI